MENIHSYTREIHNRVKFGELLSQTALLERGWTKRQITEYLPKPTLYKNPRFPSQAPMKVWDINIVNDAEEELR